MKYYSEITKKIYNTEAEAIEDESKVLAERKAAEEKAAALKAEKTARINDINTAYSEYIKAKKAFNKMVEQYNKDYNEPYSVSKSFRELFDDLFI